ncbi:MULTISPECIES: hypothetical protein [Xanthomonas]|uniref:hypothetical protein n=1 Tax=Xanthomonas TaxID=338 RepID=UPI001ADA19F8|nr:MULTISPECIES: hypothetical protein [unclassified Xanthomonas]MBO9874475.1 hypothetical protein [Xanthomonas sp. D-93]WNH44541.1 hypothetical protein PG878_18830 [Xanthomonas sp. A6251]
MESAPFTVSQRPPATRLFALLAREARTGVIFRRGPSKQVQLIHWDLRDDSFVHGQWFKGRIYERRCDLSPSGRLLVYFASKQYGDFGTWTALSRPPFFTALALWPKGDCWGGGGMFEDEQTLLLNHRPREGRDPFPMPTGFQLPHHLQVRPFGKYAGGGEDEPIDGVLRERDGWRLCDDGEGERGGLRGDALFRFSRPRVREKPGANGRRLQSLLHAVGQDNHAWYGLDHRVLDRDGNVLVDLPGSDWADWDGGDLVFAREGGLYRLRKSDFREVAQRGEQAFQLLHDFSGARFAPLAPTADALKY